MLPGILFDRMEIMDGENRSVRIDRPVVAVSKEPLFFRKDFTNDPAESLFTDKIYEREKMSMIMRISMPNRFRLKKVMGFRTMIRPGARGNPLYRRRGYPPGTAVLEGGDGGV